MILLFLSPGIIMGGCDLFNTSLVEYYLDHSGDVQVRGFTVNTRHIMDGERILIPPGEATVIGLALINPRNFSLTQEILGAPPGKISLRQNSSTEIELHIAGAKEGDVYDLTLALKSLDGLRDFLSYPLRIRCVSFETGLQDFTINGEPPPVFDPLQNTFRINVPYSCDTVTLKGTAAHPEAALAFYAGKDDSGTALARGTGTAEATPALKLGDNYFYIKISAPSSTVRGYVVAVYRASATDRAITAFNITGPVSAAGVIDEAAKTITVTVPYGTDLTAMTATATHTGDSISPDPAAAKSYAGPVSYRVSAADGSTQDYTVTVTVMSDTAKAITAFSITNPVSAEGVIDEAAKTVTVTVPYGTDLTAMTATATHTGASISPDPAAERSYADPMSYTVTAEDGTTQNYTVTVKFYEITISGIIVKGLSALSFGDLPASPVAAKTPITITIDGGVAVSGWHINVNKGPASTTYTEGSFEAPAAPGFYNVNVIATVQDIPYSGSFGITVK
jgi:hypothetical protein